MINEMTMNRLRLNLVVLLLAVVGATIFICPGNSLAIAELAALKDTASHKGIAQISLIPAPSLQEEQPADIILSSETTLPPEVKNAVLNDAVKRSNKTVTALKILEAQMQQWSDGCLGLGKPDEFCTQVITSGWRVVVTDGLKNWTYRTDDVGNAVRLEH